MADQSEPKNNIIVINGVVIAVLLFFIVIGLSYFFQSVKYAEMSVKVEQAPNDQLADLRAREDRLLHSYALIESEDSNLVRIPIERAIELQAVSLWQDNPNAATQPPPGTSTATPTPAASPDAAAPAAQSTPAPSESGQKGS